MTTTPPTTPPIPRREFGLLRYFVTASVVTLAVVTTIVGMLFARETRRDVIEQAEGFAVMLVGHVHRQVQSDFVVPTMRDRGYVDLDDAEQQAALDRIVRRAGGGFGVERIYFFDLQGRITYSTVPEHVGHQIAENPYYDRARAGKVSSNMVDRASPLDAGGALEVPLLETYVPVRDGQGRITGVIETYQNAERIAADVRAASVRVAAVSAASMLLTVFVLFLVFRRGDRIIRTRTEELLAANAALAELTETLERRVAERTETLMGQKRLAWLGTLATGIAHEINNPLASIATASEGLLRRVSAPEGGPSVSAAAPSDADADDFRDYLEIIRDEAFRAKGITADLLTFARQDGRPRTGPVHVNAVLRTVASVMKLRERRASHELVLDLPPDEDLPTLTGDPGKLLQVLFNVTDNAVDALPAEGGRVTWTTAVEKDGDAGRTIVLRCHDDGAGIAAEDLEQVLSPFFTTKEPGAGTGLGLSISQAIIESLDGAISVGSDGPGTGATVTIRLPVPAEPAVAGLAPSARAQETTA